MPTLAAWYSYLNYEEIIDMTADYELKRRRKRVLEKAMQRDSATEFVSLAHIDEGKPRIKDEPPLIYHSAPPAPSCCSSRPRTTRCSCR